jgi:outer membrane protein OmpA-like peptidoglycan-associated protein
MRKIADIAAHVDANSPIRVEIGGYADPRGSDQHSVSTWNFLTVN